MLSYHTNGGRLGETINFLYGIFKFCNINNISYKEIVVPINYTNIPFVRNEKPQFVYKENMEMFSNIKYIFKDVDEEYFKDFSIVNLNCKTDLAQLKNFYYYNNIKKDKNIIFENWWSINDYWIFRDPRFRFDILDYICRPKKLVKRIRKQNKKLLSKKTVAIHVRRCDYSAIICDNLLYPEFRDKKNLFFSNKTLYTSDNIDKIIRDNIKTDNNILIFSDDIEWCIKNFSIYKNVYFPHGKPYEDMILMSLCDTVIFNKGSLFSLIPYILCRYKI